MELNLDVWGMYLWDLFAAEHWGGEGFVDDDSVLDSHPDLEGGVSPLVDEDADEGFEEDLSEDNSDLDSDLESLPELE